MMFRQRLLVALRIATLIFDNRQEEKQKWI